MLETALQDYLKRARQRALAALLPMPMSKNCDVLLCPGIDPDDMSALVALLDEGLRLEQLR